MKILFALMASFMLAACEPEPVYVLVMCREYKMPQGQEVWHVGEGGWKVLVLSDKTVMDSWYTRPGETITLVNVVNGEEVRKQSFIANEDELRINLNCVIKEKP